MSPDHKLDDGGASAEAEVVSVDWAAYNSPATAVGRRRDGDRPRPDRPRAAAIHDRRRRARPHLRRHRRRWARRVVHLRGREGPCEPAGRRGLAV